MIIGIVGAEAAKFTPATEREARIVIRELLEKATRVVSGACHRGGIDEWAAQEARAAQIPVDEYPARVRNWSKRGGYRERNVKIAEACTLLVCITPRRLPPAFRGWQRDEGCPHCLAGDHVASGGCWTMRYASRIGKRTSLIIVGEVDAVAES